MARLLTLCLALLAFANGQTTQNSQGNNNDQGASTSSSASSSGKNICQQNPPPNVVLTWGADVTDTTVNSAVTLDGWRVILGQNNAEFNATRQAALYWYSYRFGFNNTVLSYDPSTGISILPQGYMVPTRLNASGHYNLWAESGASGIGCVQLQVIEWVLFTTTPGYRYGGTYGDWANTKNPTTGSVVGNGDVVSIGTYAWLDKNSVLTKVQTFQTWFPVRQDYETSYNVDNIIQDPDYGSGYGMCRYRNYALYNQTGAPAGKTLQFSQARCVHNFPGVLPPAIGQAATP
jgi:hypothetical protein